MPYKNIVFVKLMWKDLLHNDDRFVERLNDEQKGLYLMLLLLAGATSNNIKNDENYLKRTLNLRETTQKIRENLDVILKTYPKLISQNGFLKFKKFKGLHNPIRHAEGTPKYGPQAGLDKIKNREDKEKNRYMLQFFSEKHKEVTGVAYPITYGKDQRLIYDLLSVYDNQTLQTLIVEFFAGAKDKTEWWFDKTLSVGMFKSLIPQIINRARKK